MPIVMMPLYRQQQERQHPPQPTHALLAHGPPTRDGQADIGPKDKDEAGGDECIQRLDCGLERGTAGGADDDEARRDEDEAEEPRTQHRSHSALESQHESAGPATGSAAGLAVGYGWFYRSQRPDIDPRVSHSHPPSIPGHSTGSTGRFRG